MINLGRKLFLCIWITTFFFTTHVLHPLELVMLNDIVEIAETKKIMLKIIFSEHEKVLYKEMFRFSSNNPQIKLRFWKASITPKSEYIIPFHQPKRIFTHSFSVELTVEVQGLDESNLQDQLANTSIAVSYVILDDRQKHHAKTIFTHLDAINKSKKEEVSLMQIADNFEKSFENVLVSKDQPISPLKHYDEEAVYLKRFEDFCLQLYDLITSFLARWTLFFIIFIAVLMGLLFFALFIMQNTSQTIFCYVLHVVHSLVIFLPFVCIAMLSFFGCQGVALVSLGLYNFLLGNYFIINGNEKENFNAKCLRMIGGGLVISSLPLVIKGILFFVIV